MSDIGKELLDIQTNRYGIDIRMPIHDALAALAGADAEIATRAAHGFPIDFGNADISAELQVIQSDPKGANVKAAIYSALSKLSQVVGQTNYISAGLTPIEVEVEEITGEYAERVYGITGSGCHLQRLYEIFQSTPIIPRVTYEETSETEHVLSIYCTDETSQQPPFVTITSTYYNSNWWYQYSVYVRANTSASERTAAFNYPPEMPEEPSLITAPLIYPRNVFVGENAIIVQIGPDNQNAFVFAIGEGNTRIFSMTCGTPFNEMGYYYSEVVPRTIRALSFTSTISEFPTVWRQAYKDVTDVLALSPIITEYDDVHAKGAYITLTCVTSTCGLVWYGNRAFYLSGPYMIEA